MGVGFQAVADALGAVVDDRGWGEDLGGWAGVPQARRGDAVEVPRAHRAPVEGFPVGGERDAVGADGDVGDVGDGEAGAGDGVDGFAPDGGDELRLGADGGVAVEVAAGLAGAEVEGTITPSRVEARPVSRIQRRSLGSMATDCTPMR